MNIYIIIALCQASDDVCQLRFDFETFSGFAIASGTGICTDTFAVTGQTGVNPPSICGTNSGLHSKALLLSFLVFYCLVVIVV